MTQSTLLTISGLGIADFSARGLTQALEPLPQASQQRRTVNGVLKDISSDLFRKYKTTISCSDLEAPAFDGAWPGLLITVGCVQELSFLTSRAVPGVVPNRPIVTGSMRPEGLYTYYRPILDMMVTSFTLSTDEYGATVGWTLIAEEV